MSDEKKPKLCTLECCIEYGKRREDCHPNCKGPGTPCVLDGDEETDDGH